MRTRLLNELKQAFQPYYLLWNEWINYKYNGLSSEEIYTLNIQIKNNFTVSIDKFVMFYNRIEIIEGITLKLKLFFNEFKEWAVLKWQISLFRLTRGFDTDTFLKTRISDLDICMELKDSLMQFGGNTLNDIFDTYSDRDFKTPRLFDIILDTLNWIKKENQVLFIEFSAN